MNWRARWNAPAAVNRYFLARKLEMTVFIFAREAGKTDKLIKDYLEISELIINLKILYLHREVKETKSRAQYFHQSY
jgi:hypothetical protein